MRNKQKEEIITTFKEFLGACIKSKKKRSMQYLSASKNSLN